MPLSQSAFADVVSVSTTALDALSPRRAEKECAPNSVQTKRSEVREVHLRLMIAKVTMPDPSSSSAAAGRRMAGPPLGGTGGAQEGSERPW